MLTLFKYLVISRLDYASWQLWSPYKISQIIQLEKVQRSITKHIAGLSDLSYHERLQTLKLYSLQRRRERYCIILIWKIIENKSQNLSDPILCKFSDWRGRSCVMSHVDTGRLGTLAYNSFRWRTSRLFNSLPKVHLPSCLTPLAGAVANVSDSDRCCNSKVPSSNPTGGKDFPLAVYPEIGRMQM